MVSARSDRWCIIRRWGVERTRLTLTDSSRKIALIPRLQKNKGQTVPEIAANVQSGALCIRCRSNPVLSNLLYHLVNVVSLRFTRAVSLCYLPPRSTFKLVYVRTHGCKKLWQPRPRWMNGSGCRTAPARVTTTTQ